MTIKGPKGLEAAEYESLVVLVDKVFRAGGESSMPDEYPLLYCSENWDNVRVFSDDGRVVAHIGMVLREVCLGASRHLACCLGSVCCDPDYRGQGLATRLLEDVRQRALAMGCDLFLISGGRGLYKRAGYVGVGGFRVFAVTRKGCPPGRTCVMRPRRPDDLAALVKLHAAEPVRFVRTPEDFAALLGTGKVANTAGDVRVVCTRKDPAPLAYVAYQLGGAPWDNRPANAVTVREIAGPRAAVAGVLGALLDEYSSDDLAWHSPAFDAEVGELARAHGWPSEPRGFGGTVGIIDPALFWERSEPCFRELLGAEADALSLDCSDGTAVAFGDERVSLPDMASFTRFVFEPDGGGRPGVDEAPDLGRVLKRLFPLPLVDYGLNYV